MLFLILLLLSRPLLQALVFLLGEAHGGAVLGSRDAFDVYWVVEVAEVLVGLADAIVLGAVAILDVSHAPGIVTDKLEGA